MDFVVVLKVQVFGNNRKSKARKGGLLGATFSQFHGGKGPGAGNLSSSGIQPRSNLQEKDSCERVFRMLQKFQFLHRHRLGSLCWKMSQCSLDWFWIYF